MKKSRIARPIAVVESPAVRSLPLVELLVDTKAELFELMVRSGLRVLDAMLEEDRTALCGPRYAHQPTRAASRAGTVPGDVVLLDLFTLREQELELRVGLALRPGCGGRHGMYTK